MAPDDAHDLPDVAAVLGGVLARVEAGLHPLVVATAERLAARRYRRWAEAPSLASWKEALLACAEREEAIAERVESLYPDAPDRIAAIRRAVPDLEEVNRELFAGLDLERQITLQAGAERLGGATWRAFAAAAEGAAAETMSACAPLEIESAELLESLLASVFGAKRGAP